MIVNIFLIRLVPRQGGSVGGQLEGGTKEQGKFSSKKMAQK